MNDAKKKVKYKKIEWTVNHMITEFWIKKKNQHENKNEANQTKVKDK